MKEHEPNPDNAKWCKHCGGDLEHDQGGLNCVDRPGPPRARVHSAPVVDAYTEIYAHQERIRREEREAAPC